jgi:CheY-like chemotaxis protein
VARLLVVEDDPDVRDLISMRLVMVGHRVIAMPDADPGAWTRSSSSVPPDATCSMSACPDGRLRTAEPVAGDRPSQAPAIFVSGLGAGAGHHAGPASSGGLL